MTMKWTRNILLLLAILAFSAAELFAQTASSATQVVTFGVRRAALQVPSASNVANMVNRSPLKVTAGSQSRFQDPVELKTTTADQTFSSAALGMNAGVPDVRPMNATHALDLSSSRLPITKSFPSGKMFVTLTE
jgi:hypothetical protein